ncbi:MAG: zf-HC2 domain-containing protein, partial [Bacteroidales bacterium]|nr:zf-HC2 domain-containing protein [Bacteroidales bacterium]
MNNSFCKKFDSYIGLIIDGEPITEKIRSQLENHLTQCKKCRDQLFQFKQVDGVIKGMMESKLQQHISTDELGALLDNQIESITEKIRIEIHLKECQACQETYQQLKLLNQEWSTYEVQDLPITPISSWFERL